MTPQNMHRLRTLAAKAVMTNATISPDVMERAYMAVFNYGWNTVSFIGVIWPKCEKAIADMKRVNRVTWRTYIRLMMLHIDGFDLAMAGRDVTGYTDFKPVVIIPVRLPRWFPINAIDHDVAK